MKGRVALIGLSIGLIVIVAAFIVSRVTGNSLNQPSTLQVPSGQAGVQVTVMDGLGPDTLTQASVTLTRNGVVASTLTQTDQSGMFEFVTPLTSGDKFAVTVSAAGYQVATVPITLRANHSTQITVPLKLATQ